MLLKELTKSLTHVHLILVEEACLTFKKLYLDDFKLIERRKMNSFSLFHQVTSVVLFLFKNVLSNSLFIPYILLHFVHAWDWVEEGCSLLAPLLLASTGSTWKHLEEAWCCPCSQISLLKRVNQVWRCCDPLFFCFSHGALVTTC